MKTRLLKNAAKCLECNNVIESYHVHDYAKCKCGNISVDGGLHYLKRSFQNSNWLNENEWIEYDDTDTCNHTNVLPLTDHFHIKYVGCFECNKFFKVKKDK